MLRYGQPSGRSVFWVLIIAAIALSSFGIRGLRPGRFSFVHVVSIAMVSLFAGSLLVAGGFTLVPGRVMHTVVFGSSAR